MSQRQRMGNQPMIVLSEESQRTSGKDAQNMNITAGKAVAESVRTTLGPKGMDKMLVDSGGSVVVTNDGVTILKEMDIDHPAANMIVEVSETQEEEVGDGTTSAVVVAGELLDQAEELLDQDIHATTLAQGYRQAAEKAKDILEEEAIEVSEDDRDTLVQIAETAMTGKGAENSRTSSPNSSSTPSSRFRTTTASTRTTSPSRRSSAAPSTSPSSSRASSSTKSASTRTCPSRSRTPTWRCSTAPSK